MISLEGFLWLVVVGLGFWAYRSSATQQTTVKAAPAPKKAKKPPRPAVRADEKACGVSRAMLRNGLVLVLHSYMQRMGAQAAPDQRQVRAIVQQLVDYVHLSPPREHS